MKNIRFYLLGVPVMIAACHSGSVKKDTAADSNAAVPMATHASAVEQHLPENFYKRFQGIIGDRNVILNLNRTGKDFDGALDDSGTRSKLILDTLINRDSLILKEINLANSAQDKKGGLRLHLKWTGTVLEGTASEGGKRMSLHFEERYPEGSYPFNISNYTDSAKAFTRQNNSPQAQISYTYLFPAGSSTQEKWLDGQLKKALDIPVTSPWPAGIKNASHSYLENYKKELSDQGADGDIGAAYNYEQLHQFSLRFNTNGYVILEQLMSDYAGGAHGNYNSTMLCFDLKKQRRLSLADVVKIDTLALQQLVEKNFRIQYHVKTGEALSTQLFEDHLAANSNFYFDSKGIGFLYNPYEVASYAQGQLVVSVPFTELKPFLNKDFVQRMGL